MSMYIIYVLTYTITVGGELGKRRKKHMFLFNTQR